MLLGGDIAARNDGYSPTTRSLEGPRMELHQLRYVIAVAEMGSFSRAAERLFVVQSNVSAQVRKLERELGAP